MAAIICVVAPKWRNGRRGGLKNRWGSTPVWVQVPPSAPRNKPYRGVAQPGRAPRSGRGGRWFKSTRPDHITKASVRSHRRFWFMSSPQEPSPPAPLPLARERGAASFRSRNVFVANPAAPPLPPLGGRGGRGVSASRSGMECAEGGDCFGRARPRNDRMTLPFPRYVLRALCGKNIPPRLPSGGRGGRRGEGLPLRHGMRYSGRLLRAGGSSNAGCRRSLAMTTGELPRPA